MAKAKKLTKREHENLLKALQDVQGWKQEAMAKYQELSDLQRKEWMAMEKLDKLSVKLEKKYGSVNIDIESGNITEDEQQVPSTNAE